jgi:hypothetical protein
MWSEIIVYKPYKSWLLLLIQLLLLYDQIIGVCSALGVVGGPTEEYGDWLMYAHATTEFSGSHATTEFSGSHATTKFFGFLWYSSIILNTAERSGNQFNPEHAEIRLSLRSKNCFHINRNGSIVERN